MKRKTKTIYRSAVTGEIVTEETARQIMRPTIKQEVEIYSLGRWFEMNDEILELLEDGDTVVIKTPQYIPEKRFAIYSKEEQDFTTFNYGNFNVIQPQEVEAIVIIEK